MSRSDRCVKTCHELRSALPIAEGQVVPFQCDVSSEDQVHETVRSIVSHFGKIDALVNAAGVSIDRLVLKTTKADLLEIFGTNTFGSLYMAKAASRYMIKEKKGSIVFIGSIVGVTGGVGQIAYASSKSALIGATKTLSLELAQYGIRTNLVSLGFVHTDMTAHVPEFTKEKYRMQTPGQRFSTVEEASQVVLKVLEDREMNGRHVLVNGDLVSFL
ncbi:carbonyl reductase family member 4-like [Schistocerca gregaria]|uniref:carbonyl reductase family member 4-like n=1 Tax=Schistocerca gregaria TaxID=7010 RepID=UPI00211EB8A5|nr:carbonyl reductase family member 4-like [Schistocerca gregaria]